MPKRKKQVVVEEIETNQSAVFVFADEGLVKDIEQIEGVMRVIELGKPEYSVHLDPRYDRQEVIAEIEALNKDSDIPDEFK